MRVVTEFNLHFKEENNMGSHYYMSLSPITHFSDVAKVFFSPEDYEVWQDITSQNLMYDQADILRNSQQLLLAQNRVFDAHLASTLLEILVSDSQ